MQYVRLGRSSLKVSRIALGAMGIGDPAWRSWVLTEEQARPVVRQALETGITLFDTCDYYSAGQSEIILGRLLREMARREEVVIATKLGNPMGKGPNARGYSRKHIVEATEASLQRLGVETIDLLQTHIWDPASDIDEMVHAFDDLVQAGKCSMSVRPTCHAGNSRRRSTPRATATAARSSRCRTTTTSSGARTSAR
jgi:aryl-alcohol dehydrogenase-like predicted oxidoreductase